MAEARQFLILSLLMGSEQRRLFFHGYDRGGIYAVRIFNSGTLLY